MADLRKFLIALAGVMVVAALAVASFVFLQGERDVSVPQAYQNQGRNLVLLLQESANQRRLNLPAYVASNGITSSTHLWRQLVKDQILGLNLSWFAGPDHASHTGDNLETFQSEHNAWSILISIPTNAPSEMPFIFTSNLLFTNDGGVVRSRLSEQADPALPVAVVVDVAGRVETIDQQRAATRTWALTPGDLDHILIP